MGKVTSTNKTKSPPKTQRKVKHSKEERSITSSTVDDDSCCDSVELYVDDPFCDSHDDRDGNIVEFCCEILHKCKERFLKKNSEVYIKCCFSVDRECKYDQLIKILRNYGFDVKKKKFEEGDLFNVEFYVYWGPFDHSNHEGEFLKKKTDSYFEDFQCKYLWLSEKRAHDDDPAGGLQFQYTSVNQKRDKEFLFQCLLYESYSIEEMFQFCDSSIRADKEFITSLAGEHVSFAKELDPLKYLKYVVEDLKKDKDFIKNIVGIYSNSEEVVNNVFHFADDSIKKDLEYVRELMKTDSVIYESLPMDVKKDDGIIKQALLEHPNLLNCVPATIRLNYERFAIDSKRKLKTEGNYSNLDSLRFGII